MRVGRAGRATRRRLRRRAGRQPVRHTRAGGAGDFGTHGPLLGIVESTLRMAGRRDSPQCHTRRPPDRRATPATHGYTRSLRSLDLLAAGLHAEGGPAYNLVRAADRADRSDLKVTGAVQRDTSGSRLTGTARLTAPEGLLPRPGPMTLLFALAWDEPPTDPRGVLMMHQGAEDPVRDLDGSERANGRTWLSYDPAGRWRIYQEAFHRLKVRQRRIARSPDPKTPAVCALTYDGRWLTWHTPASAPVILSNDV